MIKIRMPDNTIKEFDTNQVTGITLLDSIGSTKLKDTAALMIVKDGGIVDLDHNLKDMDQVEILTKTDPRVLETIRHSVAHVLAEAVKDLFPDAQLTIGPVIKDGFYYDFARESSFSTHDLEALEKRMREIIKSGAVFSRKEFSKSEAIEFFKKRGEDYKIEIIKDLSEEDPITIYFQGEFADLCRGPHVRSTKCIDPNAFKLTKVSGAYWRGDSKNAVLQRIYGAVFSTEQELNQHLNFLKEAEERDHRKIGREMDLFHFQEEAPGAAFWHPNGWTLFQTLVSYMRRKQKKAGYLEISTPELMSRCLWETSGHWEKFKECMYTARSMDEDRVYAIRPMNCPGGVQIFKHGLVSYRELPMRVAEFGRVHRFEASGALYGLMRVRSFVQDDAHIYCAENQLMEEVTTLCKFLLETYVDFGFDNVRIKFSDRPTTRIGSDTIWDKAEKALLDALEILGVPYTINKGEGAFYGPKLEFVLSDTIGRDWQIGTVQVDLNLPERFDISYIGEDGKRHRPIMLHRAVLGSVDRFIGILLEHYAGKLPIWLAPVQVAVLPIGNDVADYAEAVYTQIEDRDVRTILDKEAQTLSYKLRKHIMAKVPVLLIIGKEEKESESVTIRIRAKQETLSLQKTIDYLEKVAHHK